MLIWNPLLKVNSAFILRVGVAFGRMVEAFPFLSLTGCISSVSLTLFQEICFFCIVWYGVWKFDHMLLLLLSTTGVS